MQAKAWQARMRQRTILWAPAAAAFLVLSCGRSEAPPTIDLTPFKDLARTSDCSDIKNRLFLIDGALVLWDREGSCPDAAYMVRLSGGSVDQVLCELHDSIGGPMKVCHEVQYKDMFDTIAVNLDQPDLGLGRDHHVEPIDF